MSLASTLRRLIDPVAARREEQVREAERERDQVQTAGDPPRFVCRLCGLAAEREDYCPECLAPTMEPARDPRGE